MAVRRQVQPIESLEFLPSEAREQAMLISKHLPEAKKAKFHEQLAEVNERLRKQHEAREQTVTSMENANRDFETHLSKTERGARERTEQQEELADVESQMIRFQKPQNDDADASLAQAA